MGMDWDILATKLSQICPKNLTVNLWHILACAGILRPHIPHCAAVPYDTYFGCVLTREQHLTPPLRLPYSHQYSRRRSIAQELSHLLIAKHPVGSFTRAASNDLSYPGEIRLQISR